MVRDLTAATRESFISNSNATTYPSTFSSGQPSYLGLSDSPHHSSHPHSANSSDGYAPPPSPWRRRRTLRDANVPEEVFTPVDKPLPPVQTRQRPSHTFVFAGRQSLSADGQRSQTVPAAQQDVRPRRSRPDLRSSTSHNSIHAVREAGETEQRVYSSPTRQSAERPQGQRPVVKRRSGLSQSTTAVDNFPARSEEPRGIPAQATPTREIRSTPDRGRQHETEARASPTKQSKESSSGWLQTPERRTPVKVREISMTRQDTCSQCPGFFGTNTDPERASRQLWKAHCCTCQTQGTLGGASLLDGSEACGEKSGFARPVSCGRRLGNRAHKER